MTSLIGGSSSSKAQAANNFVFTGLKIQTSVIGRAIPIVYGTTVCGGNVIWQSNIGAIAGTSSSSGKGGTGLLGGGTSGTRYQAALAFAICEGPIQGINFVYDGKSVG